MLRPAGGDGLKLRKLLDGIALAGGSADFEMEISGISCDTREMEPGTLFVALRGYKTDGHRYLKEAAAMGAAAVLCEQAPEELSCPVLLTRDTRAALAAAAANWFGHPAEQMTMVGVTGTNGKTTTTSLIKTMLERTLPRAKVGLIGTNRNLIGKLELPASRTTPDAYELQALLRVMADTGCTHVVMEVSSHALVLHRTDGIRFAAGVFTNLTQDHLDFHRTMEEYRAAKGLLFRQTDLAILNLDDEAGRHYRGTVSCPVFTYSENKDSAHLTAKNIRLFPDFVEFEAVTQGELCRIHLPIPGGFTIYNALGAISCGLALGLKLEKIAAALRCVEGVKGRVEVVPTPTAYTVLIDYAHTPNALENILLTAREFTAGRLICLFGCGGDRDRTKRPMMGGIAADLADLSIVTSDNPRTEAPEDIIADILAGMPRNMGEGALHVEPDRRAAIRYALSVAETGDVVVLAGKGHETYQEVGGVQYPFDEREEVAAFFKNRPKG